MMGYVPEVDDDQLAALRRLRAAFGAEAIGRADVMAAALKRQRR
jgi:hypothetical protein